MSLLSLLLRLLSADDKIAIGPPRFSEVYQSDFQGCEMLGALVVGRTGGEQVTLWIAVFGGDGYAVVLAE